MPYILIHEWTQYTDKAETKMCSEAQMSTNGGSLNGK